VLARQFWVAWTKPSDLGLRMMKLGILLLIATLIVKRIIPDTIELPAGDWLAIWLIARFYIVLWMGWMAGAGLTLVGTARIVTINAP
jgi:hypothetical protein